MPRPCSICNHPARREIEAAVQAGEPYSHIAEQYGFSKATITRHRKHLHAVLLQAPSVAERYETPGGLALLDGLRHAQLNDTSDLKRYLENLNSVILDVLRESFLAGQAGTALHAARELRQSLKLIAELLNALNCSPQTIVQVGFVQSAEWVRIREIIAQALEPYPEARLALSAALEAARA